MGPSPHSAASRHRAVDRGVEGGLSWAPLSEMRGCRLFEVLQRELKFHATCEQEHQLREMRFECVPGKVPLECIISSRIIVADAHHTPVASNHVPRMASILYATDMLHVSQHGAACDARQFVLYTLNFWRS